MTTIATPCIVDEVITRALHDDDGEPDAARCEYTISVSTLRNHANPTYMQLTISTQDAHVASHLTPGARVIVEVRSA